MKKSISTIVCGIFLVGMGLAQSAFGLNSSQGFVFGASPDPVVVAPPPFMMIQEDDENDSFVEKGMTEQMVRALLGNGPDKVVYDNADRTLVHGIYKVAYFKCSFRAEERRDGTSKCWSQIEELRGAEACVYYTWSQQKKAWVVYKTTGRFSDAREFIASKGKPVRTMMSYGRRLLGYKDGHPVCEGRVSLFATDDDIVKGALERWEHGE